MKKMKLIQRLRGIVKVSLFTLQTLMIANSADAFSANPINHVFLRLDVATLSEISKSEFLKNEFSDFYAGQMGDFNSKWTAVYIQGENTYLELFDSNGSTTKADVGLALGVDDKDHFLKYMPTLSKICTQPLLCEIENRVNPEKQSVWFSQFKVLDTNDKLDTWIMAYDTDYVKLKPTPAGSSWSDSDVSRKRYNSEWYKPERFLRDIEEVHLTVTSEHFSRLLKIMDGQPMLTMSANKKGSPVIVDGKAVDAVIFQNGKKYFFLNVGPATKVDKIVMTLNRNAGNKDYTFGKSKLELKNQTAVWSFH